VHGWRTATRPEAGMAEDLEPKCLTQDQAARRIGGISVHSLRKLDIPIVRFGGRVMYRVEDIDSFIDNHVVEVA
jgi:hypothetical protein